MTGDRRTVRIYVIEVKLPDVDNWPLSDFTKLIDRATQGVPEEYRGALRIDIYRGDTEVGDPPMLTLYYERPETDMERETREHAEADRAERRRQDIEKHERAVLKQLIAKYGVPK